LGRTTNTNMVIMKLEARYAKRHAIQMKARYLKKGNSGWAECEITDISRKGIRVRFLPGENISEDSEICVEICLPEQLDPLHVQGTVKWICKVEDGYVSGIALMKPLVSNLLESIVEKYQAVLK